MDTGLKRQKVFIYIFLTFVSLAVYGQVGQFDFINFDDNVYITDNHHVQSGITLESIRWALTTTYAEFWHPLTWLSLMADYELYGLHAGGYHVTNIIFHILSTLLLFWLFHRMTGALWKSAFVAAFFALHPLHVESVAWVSERKDVLSAFFWMLTLCLYVYYAEKPVIKRYALVALAFSCALMSKPMAVTLPAVMMLMDYWPLKRFESRNGNLFAWQLKEKAFFFILSAAFSIITIYAQRFLFVSHFSVGSRFANAPVAFMTYLAKTFWPHDLAVFYPFSDQLPVWQIAGSTLLIMVISIAAIVTLKRLPFLFVGWFWYAITLTPVIGIIRATAHSMHDNYTYLPSIGIGVMLAWGTPLLFAGKYPRKNILFPVTIVCLAFLSLLSWKQCGYWENSVALWQHTLKVTRNNFMAHCNFGSAILEKGKTAEALDHFNKAVRLQPDHALFYLNRGSAYDELGRYQDACADFTKAIFLEPDYAEAHYNRGNTYAKLKQYQAAIENYNEAIRIRPDYAKAYSNRGNAYAELGQYHNALKDYNMALHLAPGNAETYYNRGNISYITGRYRNAVHDYNESLRHNPNDAKAYYNRGNAYGKLGQFDEAITNYNKAIDLDPDYVKAYHNRGVAYNKIGRHQQAIQDYNEAIRRNPNYTQAYINKALLFFETGNNVFGCRNAQKACDLGNCAALKKGMKEQSCR